LDFVDLSSEEVRETELPGWPKYGEYGNKVLSLETRIFLVLPSLTGSFYGDVGYDVQIAYSLAYLRQLKPEERRKVLEQLSELGYIELSAWCSDSYDLGIEERADAIERSYPGEVEVNRNKLLSFVEDRDRIAGRSRALRVAVEALEAQAPGPEYRAAAYRIIENKAIREVFFGLRAAVVTELAFSEEELETIREVLWGQRQVRVDGQGGIFNIMKLDEGKYYIYEEYILKRIARDKGDGYIVAPYSRKGLEAMIRQDMSRRRGEYYDITSNTEHRDGEGSVRPAERLSRNILAGVKEESFSEWKAAEYAYHAGKLAPRVFTVDVPAVDVNTTATINREAALRKQLTAELETETIFNNRIPQIIIDDSEPGILAQNRKNTTELGEKYGVQIIHLTAADRERDQRAIALRLKDIYAKELAEDSLSGSVKAVFRNNGILKENGIDEEGLIKYVNANVFHHISGVRNYTLLKVKELWEKGILKRARTVMSMDDDAPPETYLLKRRAGNAVYKDVPGYNREQIIKERLARREKYVEDMLKEASRMIGGRVSDEAEFFALLGDSDNYDKLCGLVREYYGYSADGSIGLIPQAMGQITRLSERYVGPEWMETTHQRYESLQLPLPEYMVATSDFVYPRPRTEKKDNTFMAMPVDIFAPAGLIGKKVEDTYLPRMYGDLRGTMANPDVTRHHSLSGDGRIDDKTITYLAYPFINDQDSSGIAQLLRYLEQEEKTGINLQHCDQSALLVEGVGGFATDGYVIFNRAVLDNKEVSPSIGRDLRLEEPPFIKWVRSPVEQGQLVMAFSPVAGAQQREIGERMYNIAKQDFDEQVGGAARAFYEKQ
jgi:hypothetical protein